MKIVNVSDETRKLNFTVSDLKKKESLTCQGSISLSCDEMDVENTRENPDRIVPVSSFSDGINEDGTIEIAPKTFKIYVFARN